MLQQHRIRHLDAKDFNFKCLICEKSFRTKHELNSHQNFHSDIKSFICKITGCNYSSKRYGDLRRHHKKHCDLNNKVNKRLLRDPVLHDRVVGELQELNRKMNSKFAIGSSRSQPTHPAIRLSELYF
jgi:uncharacterized Zn-finger protein